MHTEIIKTKSFELSVNTAGNPDAKKMVLCLPGRLDTKDYAHMVSHVNYFAEQGYFTVSFDPPGTWESPGPISEYTMTNYLKAVKEVIEYYGNKPTAVIGHSRGGTMSMMSACRFAEIELIVTVMSHTAASVPEPGTIDTGIYISKRDTPAKYEEDEKKFELPLHYFEDARTFDVAGEISQCHKPKLVFGGKRDVLVTLEEVKEDFANMGEPKEWHELDSYHDYRKSEAIIDEVNQRVSEFFTSHGF